MCSDSRESKLFLFILCFACVAPFFRSHQMASTAEDSHLIAVDKQPRNAKFAIECVPFDMCTAMKMGL